MADHSAGHHSSPDDEYAFTPEGAAYEHTDAAVGPVAKFLFWLFIVIFADLFRRSDISGWGKAGWTVFVIVVPFIGVLTYLVAQGGNMAERRRAEAEAVQARFGSYIQSVSSTGHASDQIAKAKDLLDSGAIDRAEYELLKQKALAP